MGRSYMVMENGPIVCNAPGQNASFDSVLTCALFQLPFILETIGFGYICYVLIIPITLISLFGKIQEPYRWFILNQAIWDLLISYDFICEKPSYVAYFQGGYIDESVNQGAGTCFYGDSWERNGVFYEFTKNVVKYISYAPIFLLTFSRFICLYFHRFYDHIKSSSKLIAIIIIFNVLLITIVTLRPVMSLIFDTASNSRKWNDVYQACTTDNCNQTIWPPVCNFTARDICQANINLPNYAWIQELDMLKLLAPIVLLFLSVVFTFFVIGKIAKQLKFQATHNRANAASSIRITVICFLQCLFLIILFGLMITESLHDYCLAAHEADFCNYHAFRTFYEEFYTTSNWVAYIIQPQTFRSINLFRVFIDSVLVLTILNGYRKSCKQLFKFVFWLFTNPKKVFKAYSQEATSSTNRVTFLSPQSSVVSRLNMPKVSTNNAIKIG